MTDSAVSVVIPTRNYAHYLGKAIESAVGQENVDVQVVVVDDGSEDATAEVSAAYPVEYVRIDHSGVGTARNVGIDRAQHELVAFLDADDLWKPDKLRRQLDRLSSAPEAHMVYGLVQEFLSDDATAEVAAEVLVRSDPYRAPIPSTMLLPRTTLDLVGEFRSARDSGEALDWMLRFKELGLRSVAVDDVVTLRRVHATNSGRTTREAQQQEYLRAVRRSLERRRVSERDGD